MLNGISRSFVEGYLLGLAGLPVKTALGAALPPAADREKPAMFLYNGMGPLPALPEGYDRCPYATVTDMGDGAYRLHLSDVPFFARVNASGTFNLANYYNDTGILFYMFTHNAAAGSWSVYNPDILGTNRFIAGGRKKGWANYHMPEKNGNIYIRKTAPIPVTGGKAAIAPGVFLTGVRFGALLRHYEGQPGQRAGALLSSDGCILTDRNGLYLIAKEDS